MVRSVGNERCMRGDEGKRDRYEGKREIDEIEGRGTREWTRELDGENCE